MGNRENTDVGSFLADYLDLDLDDATNKLRSSVFWAKRSESNDSASEGVSKKDKFSWLGSPRGEAVRTDGLDKYHGGVGSEDCGCGGH